MWPYRLLDENKSLWVVNYLGFNLVQSAEAFDKFEAFCVKKNRNRNSLNNFNLNYEVEISQLFLYFKKLGWYKLLHDAYQTH